MLKKLKVNQLFCFVFFKAAIKNLLQFKFFVRFPCPPYSFFLPLLFSIGNNSITTKSTHPFRKFILR